MYDTLADGKTEQWSWEISPANGRSTATARRAVGHDRRDFLTKASHSSRDALTRINAELLGEADTSQGSRPAPRIEFAFETFNEVLAADYRTEFLVEPLIVAGQPLTIAGPAKGMKTSIMLDLSLSVATGGHFLGRFPVRKSLVVGVMTGESGMATVQETLRRIARTAGIERTDRLLVTPDIPHFDAAPSLEAVERAVDKYGIEFLVVDPLYLCLNEDNQAKLAAQGQQLRAIGKLCVDRGVQLCLCHHTKRETLNLFEPLDLGHLHGSGLPEFVRQWVMLSRREPYADNGEHKLFLRAGGSAGHGGLWGVDISEGVLTGHSGRRWDVTVLDGADVRSDAKDKADVAKEQRATAKAERQLESDRRRIVETMTTLGKGETPKTIRENAGLNPIRFGPAITSLLADGSIVTCGVQKSCRGKLYDGYQLATQE